jgi:hypothetical protein
MEEKPILKKNKAHKDYDCDDMKDIFFALMKAGVKPSVVLQSAAILLVAMAETLEEDCAEMGCEVTHYSDPVLKEIISEILKMYDKTPVAPVAPGVH